MSDSDVVATTSVGPDRMPVGLLMVFVATRWMSYLSFQTLPIIIGALIAGSGVDTSTAGVLAGLELLALAVTAQVAAPWVAQGSVVRVGAIGAAVATLGQILTAFAGGPLTLAVCRLGSGFGTGLLAASANASLAGQPSPERWFSRIGAVGSAVAALILGGLPVLAQHAGQRSVFVALGLGMLVALASVRGLPAARPPVRTLVDGAGAVNRAQSFVLLAGVALFSFGQGAIWSFTERLATSIGIGASRLGGWFLAGSVIGIGGSVAAGALGTRFGRTAPVVVGVAAVAAACFVMSHAASEPLFGSMLLVYFAASQFAFPLLFGLSAVLDTSGRLVTASTNVLLLTTAAAPAIGGLIVARGGFAPVGWLAVASCTAAALLLGRVTRALDRSTRAASIRGASPG